MNTTTIGTRLDELRAMPYEDYLRTREWRSTRDRALARAKWCCEWPGCRERSHLQVHHKSYQHLGEELPEELVVCCATHHAATHQIIGTPQEQRHSPRWVVIRFLLKACRYASLADFADEVKRACARFRLPTDGLTDEIAAVLREVPFNKPEGGPAIRSVAPTRYVPPSKTEATALLAAIAQRTGQHVTLRSMPDTTWRDSQVADDEEQAARERAWEMGIEL